MATRPDGRSDRPRLVNPHEKFHFWVNCAKHVKCAGHRESDRNTRARLLVTRIEIELVRIDINVMAQVAVVVQDLNHFATTDRYFARCESTALLGHREYRTQG